MSDSTRYDIRTLNDDLLLGCVIDGPQEPDNADWFNLTTLGADAPSLAPKARS